MAIQARYPFPTLFLRWFHSFFMFLRFLLCCIFFKYIFFLLLRLFSRADLIIIFFFSLFSRMIYFTICKFWFYFVTFIPFYINKVLTLFIALLFNFYYGFLCMTILMGFIIEFCLCFAHSFCFAFLPPSVPMFFLYSCSFVHSFCVCVSTFAARWWAAVILCAGSQRLVSWILSDLLFLWFFTVGRSPSLFPPFFLSPVVRF